MGFTTGLDVSFRLGSDPRLDNGTGFTRGFTRGFTLGFGVGFGVGFNCCFGFTRGFTRSFGIGCLYFVGFRGSGNLIVSNFGIFPLRENFTLSFITGLSNSVFLND